MPDDLRYLYAPFLGKGDDRRRVVEGYVSSGDQDLDGQIVDQDWLKSELPAWLAHYGNIREQHDPRRAVGKAQSVDLDRRPGPYLAARIVDDDAWRKVQAGVYTGFSIGIKNPRILRDPAAPNGRITGGRLIEISIVDRPANDAARFVVVKRAGPHAWRDMQTGLLLEPAADQESRPVAGPMPEGGPTSAMPDTELAKPPAPDPAAPAPPPAQAAAPYAAPLTPPADEAGPHPLISPSPHLPIPPVAPSPAAEKAAPSFTAAFPSPSQPARPSALGGEVLALLHEVTARLEALAGQTDADRDGDVDTPADRRRGGEPARDADFQAQRPDPDRVLARPATLDLGFGSKDDLTAYIEGAVVRALAAQADAGKAATATAALETAAEVATLAGGIAKGLAALAGRAEAGARELGALRASVAETQADLARVKELAQPVKGALFAVDKGIGLEADRVGPPGTYHTAAPGAGEVEWLAKQVAQLGEEQRMELARQAYSAFAPKRA